MGVLALPENKMTKEALKPEQIKLKQTYMELKKQMTQIYGLTRTVQDEMDGTVVDEMLVEWLINECRSICSRFLFKDEEMKLGIYDIP